MKVVPHKKAKDTLYHGVLILLSFIMIYPFIWSTFSSFKTIQQLYSGSPMEILPDPFTLDNSLITACQS